MQMLGLGSSKTLAPVAPMRLISQLTLAISGSHHIHSTNPTGKSVNLLWDESLTRLMKRENNVILLQEL